MEAPPALHDIVLETATLYGWRTIKGLRHGCAGWDRLESNEVLTFATKLRLIDIHCLICNNSSLIADICWGDITDTITTSSVIRITL